MKIAATIFWLGVFAGAGIRNTMAEEQLPTQQPVAVAALTPQLLVKATAPAAVLIAPAPTLYTPRAAAAAWPSGGGDLGMVVDVAPVPVYVPPPVCHRPAPVFSFYFGSGQHPWRHRFCW